MTSALVLEWARGRELDTWFAHETTSTNSVAKSEVLTDPLSPPKLFLTDRQTAGRGRGDHTWTTPHGALLSTWAFQLSYAPQPILSPLIGLALFQASVRAFPDLAFNLKAPNDLYIGDKKVAGLLIENVVSGSRVLCAVGLGFNAGDAPAGVETATGLSQHFDTSDSGPSAVRWTAFLDAWYDGMIAALDSARHSEIAPEQRVFLRDALNLHPRLEEQILEVGALGQMKMLKRTIEWQNL